MKKTLVIKGNTLLYLYVIVNLFNAPIRICGIKYIAHILSIF